MRKIEQVEKVNKIEKVVRIELHATMNVERVVRYLLVFIWALLALVKKG